MEPYRIFRGLVYKFFSLAFTYPEEETIKTMETIVEDIKQIGYMENNLLEKIDNIVKELKNVEIEKLQTEYVRLFINAYPSLPCPPYESYYKTGLLSNHQIIKSLMEFYQRYELAPKNELADHIRVILEYLYIVNLDEKTSDEECLELEKEFLKKHILGWIKNFAECVEKNTKLNPYKEITKTLISFLKNYT